MKKFDHLIKEALFSDGTENYRIPPECDAGDTVRIRFRALKGNTDRVILILVGDAEDEGIEMRLAESDEIFDYYEEAVTLGSAPLSYYFEIVYGEEHCFYTRLGADGSLGSRYSFCITPGFHTPEWAKGCVMYQIFTDRFFDGDETNNVRDGEYRYLEQESVAVKDWDAPVETLDVGRFYGGDLRGIMEKLPYLKALGVEALYLNPIFVSPSNHKYDCQDYEHIDPHYGVIVKDGDYRTRTIAEENLRASDALFSEFVKACHEEEIRVIVDGVFNHCGSFNKMMDREGIYRKQKPAEETDSALLPTGAGAFVSAQSPYRKYFRFERNDEAAWQNGGNDSYEKWWNNETLPKLNYEGSTALEEYIFGIGKKWVSAPYGADGWRLDVAADLGHSESYNHSFWKRYRKAVKEANPEALILAEHYGDAGAWLKGDEWDTVMNYDAFMEPVTFFLTGMEKHSDARRDDLWGNAAAFFDMMRYAQCSMQTGSLLCAMNELSNHDHSRFLTRTNRKVGRLLSLGAEAAETGVNFGLFSAAVVMQMTLPGAPTIYYGDEAGLCGWTDPDSRRSYPWGRENHQMIDFHTYMIKLHKHEVFRKGSWKPVYANQYLLAYGRMLGDHIALVVINAGDATMDANIPVWQLGVTGNTTLSRVIDTNNSRYNVGYHHRMSRNGYLYCQMEPYSAKVYINWAADERNIRWAAE